MSDENTNIASTTMEGGVSGDHPTIQSRQAFVAPSTFDEYNTIRVIFVPIACWKVDDIRFEFGSSFIKPDARDEFQELDSLMKAHPGAPLSIFGHADPVGQDDLNKKLSGRRSQAVYGLLTRDTDLWEELYKQPLADDNWGVKSIQIMLETIGSSPGPIDGVQGSQTSNATKAFQKEKGLTMDGIAGPNTRRELFKAYMDFICVDKEGKPYQLNPEEDFLAQGAGANGKGDYQGCSEFNPRLLFSQEEEEEYKKQGNRQKRNEENAPNRRVIIYLFRPGCKVNPKKWPCPSVKDGTVDCRKRFWSDGEKRRNARLPKERREFRKTEDTFACRFYQLRMASRSPCEGLLIYPLGESAVVRIQIHDGAYTPCANTPCQVTLASGEKLHVTTDAAGWLEFELQLLTPLVTVSYTPPDTGFEVVLHVPLQTAEVKGTDSDYLARIRNFGFEHFDQRLAICQFQLAVDLPQTGQLDVPTKHALDQVMEGDDNSLKMKLGGHSG